MWQPREINQSSVPRPQLSTLCQESAFKRYWNSLLCVCLYSPSSGNYDLCVSFYCFFLCLVLLFSCFWFIGLVTGLLLAEFAKFRNATVSFVMFVRPSVCPLGTTRLPLDGFSWNLIFECFLKVCRGSLIPDKINGYFTWRPMYILDSISPNCF